MEYNLKGITPRDYQIEIANSVLKNGNSLIVLPTGLGKTIIALMIASHSLSKGKILFLAPTKPLVKQHHESVKKYLPHISSAMITGTVQKDRRISLINDNKIIIATPQTIESLLNKLNPIEFSLVIIDEAHRSVGKYSYTSISKYFKPFSQIIGMTASPGSDRVKINEIMKALSITHVEMRDLNDPSISKYFPGIKIDWIRVSLTSEYKIVSNKLRELKRWYESQIYNSGYRFRLKSRKEMLSIRDIIIKSNYKTKYNALKYLSALINLDYAVEMLETQSMDSFLRYVSNFKSKNTKGVQLLLNDRRLNEIIDYVNEHKRVHPKMQKLIDIISSNPDKKYIIFSQFVNQVEYLEEILKLYGISCHKFIGQRKGFTRKKQLEVIDNFRQGAFNVLIASSVAEEGLDIPSVDRVIFYEPVPSEIRTIQRRGRTGRHSEGEVIILITRGTRDEAYYYSAKGKEKEMKDIIRNDDLGRKRSSNLKDWF